MENMLGDATLYSRTTPSETRSRDIFHSLLDRNFIQGELRVQDKIPNVDGTIDITDSKLHLIGKIEIQLKTLDPRYYGSPKYSCDSHFIAYCYGSIVPVLLVLVDQKNKCAYWRHINVDAAHEFHSNLAGQTYALPVSKENCLNGESHKYVTLWTDIVKEIQNKVLSFDSLQRDRDALSKKLDGLLRNPTDLPVQNLKELFNFLDIYNYILDREFPSIKQKLYPEYWKIGIGIVTYSLDGLHFLLFPVKYTSSQTLVKSISKEEYDELKDDMWGNNILLIASRESANVIKYTPTKYAYHLLRDNIIDQVKKNDLFIPIPFVANEYLINFIDKFCGYLGLPAGADAYDIADLDFRLTRLMPMMEGSKKGFADWVTDNDHWIDSDEGFDGSSSHTKAIQNALHTIEAGVVPRVKVTLYCKTFSLDTVDKFMKWLVQNGQDKIHRVYKKGQVNTGMHGVDLWKTWNTDVLWKNLEIFCGNFFDAYDLYVATHFPPIAKSLRIFRLEPFSVACLMCVSANGQSTPYLELFLLKPASGSGKRKVFCFRSDDKTIPFERKGLSFKKHYTIEGKDYQVVEMWARELNFMFAYSPMYEFLKLNLESRVTEFFKEMSKINY